MVRVEEINRAFKEKGLGIEIPLPSDWIVKGVEILEKHNHPGGVRVLLSVRYIDDRGREISDIFLREGSVSKAGKAVTAKSATVQEPLKSTLLPQRETMAFADEDEARGFLDEAISHLLEDKGYTEAKQEGVDFYFQKGERGFFANLAACCDEKGLQKAKVLAVLRDRQGVMHDYGLIIPAFQESLGIPLRVQERWISVNDEYLSTHGIGIYAVNNQDPNRIYAFTIYPRSKELMRYFMITTPQWSLVKERYVAGREKG